MGFPKKISQLPAAGTLKNSDIFILVNQHDVTSQTTLGEIAASISGHTIPSFTGNTSGDCINELWVSTISGCSPVTIGPELRIDGELEVSATLNLPNLIAFSGDTAAGVGGLVVGDLWQTTSAHTIGVAGIVMIKQ
jgi:hypothetical protein